MDDVAFEAAIARWQAASVECLRVAKNNESAVQKAVLDVCSEALAIGMSALETWDYLLISSPGLFGLAGYSDSDVDRLYAVIEQSWIQAFSHTQKTR